jgi:hypothetical protein
MRRQFLAVPLTAFSLIVLTGAGNAREVVGTTKSYLPRLAATALATDGSKYTAKVTVTGTQVTSTGKTLYTGTYDVAVPEGKKVLMVFQKLNADGSLTPKTVARFATSPSGLKQTFQFNVTQSPSHDSSPISLGFTKVGAKLAKPEVNPLSEVDDDGDGVCDLQDNDDDNDGISDDQDQDEDGDGVDDSSENQDQDGDGVPDVEDNDDSQGDQQ